MTEPKHCLSVRHKFFLLLTLTLISMFDLVDRRSSPKLFEHQSLVESSTGRTSPSQMNP